MVPLVLVSRPWRSAWPAALVSPTWTPGRCTGHRLEGPAARDRPARCRGLGGPGAGYGYPLRARQPRPASDRGWADVSDAIRTMQVNEATPYVAKVPQVREALVLKQKQWRATRLARGRGPRPGQRRLPAGRREVRPGWPGRQAGRTAVCGTEGDRSGRQLRARPGQPGAARPGDQKHWLGLLASGEAIRVDTTGMEIDEVVEYLYQAVAARPRARRATAGTRPAFVAVSSSRTSSRWPSRVQGR